MWSSAWNGPRVDLDNKIIEDVSAHGKLPLRLQENNKSGFVLLNAQSDVIHRGKLHGIYIRDFRWVRSIFRK